MTRIKRSLAAYLTLFCGLIAWAAAETFSWYTLQEISSALVMGASLVAMGQWLVPAARAFRDGQSGADFFALSIFVTVFSISFQRLWINILRWLGRPEWLVYSPVSSLTAILMSYAVFLMILARGTEGGVVPRRNIVMAATGLLIAAFISVITLSLFSADRHDQYGRPDDGVSLPGFGMISCPDAKPIRIAAYCRAKINIKQSDAVVPLK